MNKLAYIATMIYVPLLIFYMSASDGSLIFHKLYFFNEKLYMLLLLVSIGLNDYKRSRRILFFSVSLINLAVILYILLDWDEALVYNFWVVFSLCLFSLLTLTIPFIYDRNAKK